MTSLVIVALMVGIIGFYAHHNFAGYINKMEMEKLGGFVDVLHEIYKTHQSWKLLRTHPRLWRSILRSGRLERKSPERLLPYRPHASQKRGVDSADQHVPSPIWDPSRLGRRISLFDTQKKLVAGQEGPLDKYSFLKIEVEGQIVGWLGLKKIKRFSHPLDVEFAKQQSKAFYLIGCSILILSGIISFFLSKHLLAPVQRLTAGMKSLTSLEFGTRIDVRTGDELGQLASGFNAMAQTLERYEKMRQQWISDIAHELRTPLSILRGEIEAIQDGIHEMNPDILNSLHQETLYLSKIVADLHELSLAEAGALFFKKDPVNPLRVLKETIDIFRTKFDQHQIAIRENLEDDPNIIFIGDADRLAQLFANLLENTLRYATKIPATLKIWRSRTENQLVLFFEDSGPGVPEESLERLFDRLYRVDPARTRAKGGSGLGLSICKNIVEAHGGTIKALNATAGGLRIEIMFPLPPTQL